MVIHLDFISIRENVEKCVVITPLFKYLIKVLSADIRS